MRLRVDALARGCACAWMRLRGDGLPPAQIGRNRLEAERTQEPEAARDLLRRIRALVLDEVFFASLTASSTQHIGPMNLAFADGDAVFLGRRAGEIAQTRAFPEIFQVKKTKTVRVLVEQAHAILARPCDPG